MMYEDDPDTPKRNSPFGEKAQSTISPGGKEAGFDSFVNVVPLLWYIDT
jgi:hypothetical protein